MIEQLCDCSFYLNWDRLFEEDSLSRNTYYIHYVRRMRTGRKFWCTRKDYSRSILIIQISYAMEFEKIFRDQKMEMFKNDKFWLGTIQLDNKDVLTEGFYSLYHINELKGGMLNVAGTILIQVKYEEIDLFIPIDENTIVGEIQVLVAKYICVYPNKFIMTGISKKDMIYLINVDDSVMKLIKKGMEYLQVHEYIYDINFLSYRNLSISMKKLQ
jgi:hypothetical protein